MNLQEARSILELSESASPEEAKKRYREFTKKFHPDVNKEPGAEDRFKKINEAYQVVSSGKSTDREEPNFGPFAQNPFAGFDFGGQSRFHQAQHINLDAFISFKESVIGCKKDIKFNRNIKCKDCNGNGHSQISNGCDACGGNGQVVSRQGNTIFQRTCNKCGGKIKTQACLACNSKGILGAEVSINVTIPGGVVDGNILKLGGMGNFVHSTMGFDQYTDAHMYIHVSAEPGLKIDGNNVVSSLEVSLLDAFVGATKKVHTVFGEHEIQIKPKSRNKDEVVLSNFGVNGTGDHKVILDVIYPENIEPLINILSNKET